MLTVLAQTKPDDAISNLGAGVKLVGIDAVPPFLLSPRIDTFATVVGVLTVAVALLMWRREVCHIHHKEITALAPAVPSLEMAVTRAPQPGDWMPLCDALHYLVYNSQWADTQPAASDRNDFDRRVGGEMRERLARGEVDARGKCPSSEHLAQCAA